MVSSPTRISLISSRTIFGRSRTPSLSAALLQEGKETYDPAKRRAIYDQVEHILVEQAVSVPLVDEFSVWVMRSNVTGTKYNFSGYPLMSDVQIGK